MAKQIKRKKNILNKIILTTNIIFALALLLSYLAPYIDPRDFSIIAVLGIGYQILLIINILFLIYWIISLSFFALISAIVIIMGINIIVEYFGVHGSILDNKKEITTIRVMTYNVHGFHGIDAIEDNSVKIKILNFINKKQPDIINFQEYFKTVLDTTNDGISDSIKKILKTKYFFYKIYGNAIFSKFQILNSEAINSAKFLSTKAIFADLKFNNKIFRVYDIHLSAIDIRDNIKDKYVNGGLDLGKLGNIIDKITAASLVRSYQLLKLKKSMNECPYPFILTGDFYDMPNSFTVNELGDGLKNAFKEKGSGIGCTYSSTFPKLQLDYIMATPQFNVINYKAFDDLRLSDHYPVISDLQLK